MLRGNQAGHLPKARCVLKVVDWVAHVGAEDELGRATSGGPHLQWELLDPQFISVGGILVLKVILKGSKLGRSNIYLRNLTD